MERKWKNSPSDLMNLLEKLDKVRGKIAPLVSSRMSEFKELGTSSSEELFKELCFCILTANYSADGGIRIQRAIDNGFLTLSEEELAKRLKELGHRFPRTRAKYIVEARKFAHDLSQILSSFPDGKSARDWLVKNVKGLGMKEASHFLRNIGYNDVAIIDFHIVDLLVREGLIQRPKTLTRKRYREIESVLEKVAKKAGLGLGELDLYLWYMETGKVLK